MTSVLQRWVVDNCTMMQQTVLLGIVRGPDESPKYHPVKPVLRWYRRCLLLSAMDGQVIHNPWDTRGGSFAGPSCQEPVGLARMNGDAYLTRMEAELDAVWNEFMKTMDQMPIHFWLHMMHAIEIMGYKHSDPMIATWWSGKYQRMVYAMHVWPETCEQLDSRLGDTKEGWLARSDEAIDKYNGGAS